MISPVDLRRNRLRSSRYSSPRSRRARAASVPPVACSHAHRPSSAQIVEWNEPGVAASSSQQFQPPSACCVARSVAAIGAAVLPEVRADRERDAVDARLALALEVELAVVVPAGVVAHERDRALRLGRLRDRARTPRATAARSGSPSTRRRTAGSRRPSPAGRCRRPSSPSSPCSASSLAPQPSVATRARSAATSSAEASVRSRITCQRIAGSPSRRYAMTSMPASVRTGRRGRPPSRRRPHARARSERSRNRPRRTARNTGHSSRRREWADGLADLRRHRALGTGDGGRRAPAARAPARDRRVARRRPGRRPALRRVRVVPHRGRARARRPTASPTRRGASSTPRATTPCSCCTPSPATATCAVPPGRGIRPTAGGATSSGPGAPIDTDRWFVVAPNMLGGCQGSTGPASIGPDGYEWASRFPYLTIRDQVAAQVRLADALGIDVWAGVIGGSMGGMHALEWAVGHPRPRRAGRHPLGAAGEHRRPDRAQLGAARGDPHRPALPGRRVLRRRRRRRPATAASRSRVGWRC